MWHTVTHSIYVQERNGKRKRIGRCEEIEIGESAYECIPHSYIKISDFRGNLNEFKQQNKVERLCFANMYIFIVNENVTHFFVSWAEAGLKQYCQH